MCNDTYGENSPSGANHEAEDRYDGNSRYGMAASVCAMHAHRALRAHLRRRRQPHPRSDVYDGAGESGPDRLQRDGTPRSIRAGQDPNVPDVVHNLDLRVSPAPNRIPCIVDGHDEGGVCIYPDRPSTGPAPA